MSEASRAEPPFAIGFASRDDVPALARLVADYKIEGMPSTDAAAIAAEAGEQLSKCLDDAACRIVFVARCGTEACGYAVVHWVPLPILRGTEGYVSDLVVSRAHRGGGLGTALLAAVEAEARRRGCVRLMLNNGKDSEAFERGFYPKHGFAERVRVANFVRSLDAGR